VDEQKSKQVDTGIRYASYYRSEYVQIRRYSHQATGWATKELQGQRSDLFAEAFRPALEFTEYRRARSPRTKRPGLEAHYSPSSSTHVKNE
jgi:hypothetical protein